jgi:hypothetical protein
MFELFAKSRGRRQDEPRAGAVQPRFPSPPSGGRTLHLRFIHQFAVNSARVWRRCDAVPVQRAGERR